MTDTDVPRLPPAEDIALMAELHHENERFSAFIEGVEAGILLEQGKITVPNDREAFGRWVRAAYAERVEKNDE